MSNAIEKVKNAIKSIEDKDLTLYFFVIDSKGAPMGSLAYVYETAKHLSDLGYNVKMLHAENDFVGVESWLGKDYASLPHYNIEKDREHITLGADDFVFVPEVYANVMSKLKPMPSKTVAILQNFGYATEVIPLGASWDDLKVRDCITTTDGLKEHLHSVMPNVNTRVIRPSVPDYFFRDNKAKKLIINVVTKNQADYNQIVKPFHWKYPMYSWVAFRNVANIERHEFADVLDESFATIWSDTNTDFGHAALEAMASGNIVIGKVPENIPDWMLDENGNLANNGVWFFKNSEAQDAIASVVQSFITNSVPQELLDNARETAKRYLSEYHRKDVEKVFSELFEQRKKELEIVLSILERQEANKEEKTEE